MHALIRVPERKKEREGEREDEPVIEPLSDEDDSGEERRGENERSED